ncbi:uncharacterized protein ACHE_50160A [Aspergillus chevalieri]|uniref:Uncharacterized protein n=1 Tax=Aspergillus chevalieri TaxID=182096 RepID=A0A7R7VQJ3_ASPCH|nr:uncharacterized protein ACHE_50160A [Aspergillus chevalieri]BCR88962.1 hypothetical protein ACHE_50160A [Aspergillus chevalieri]
MYSTEIVRTPHDDGSGQNDYILENEKKRLRQHLGLSPEPGGPSDPPKFQPLFFIEMAPNSPRGAKCKLSICGNNIWPRELRLALNPAMGFGQRYRSSADFYHIQCFEKIADFSQADFLDRIQPLTRHNWKLRGLKAGSILDGNYLVPGGVERLVAEWKVTLGRWIDKRDGVYDESKDRLSTDFDALLRKAGSAGYQNQEMPQCMEWFEYNILSSHLAPYESDGPGDSEEWNLFAAYLDKTPEALGKPHTLSTMLQHWENDLALAGKKELELDEAQRKARHQLGDKAVRALKRLSIIPMPDTSFTHGAFLG